MSIQNREFYLNVLRKEIKDRKIPISLGKTCPVKCTFCYEQDISYRQTFDMPLTTQEDWEFIFNGKYFILCCDWYLNFKF